MSVGAITLYPAAIGMPARQTGSDVLAGTRRGPYAPPVHPDATGRAATAGQGTDVQTSLGESERRSTPATPPEAVWQGRRQGPAALLAAMIENMGGAATSAYKGMYVDVKV